VLAILLVLAGIALIFGAKDSAGKIVKGVLGIVLALAALPCLLKSCSCLVAERENEIPASLAHGLLAIILLAALAIIGLIAWRRRADRARSREIWAKRNGAPRARALPAPPHP